ncbi:MAG: glycosyltransferase family 2 protein [Anaerolineae bacterium]|nr:glycosyltransferase family 2 protein [Anaerolineae bacterium]
MIEDKPLVSIGMPIHNAESRLCKALDSLLAQTYPLFDLIISDNASTDGTWLICQEYAERDSRIKLYRNEENIGLVANFLRVLDLAKGTYFMWAAYDDFWDAEFIAACVEQLMKHPDAVLCYTWEVRHYLRENSKKLVNVKLDVTHPHVRIRVQRLLAPRALPHSAIYGLMPREILKTHSAFKQVLESDLLILVQLALCGKFVTVHKILRHSNIRSKSIQERMQEHRFIQHKEIQVGIFSEHVRMFRIFSKTILESDIRLIDKIAIQFYVTLWAFRHLAWTYWQLRSRNAN